MNITDGDFLLQPSVIYPAWESQNHLLGAFGWNARYLGHFLAWAGCLWHKGAGLATLWKWEQDMNISHGAWGVSPHLQPSCQFSYLELGAVLVMIVWPNCRLGWPILGQLWSHTSPGYGTQCQQSNLYCYNSACSAFWYLLSDGLDMGCWAGVDISSGPEVTEIINLLLSCACP